MDEVNDEAEEFSLDQFALNGQSREMEERMLDDRFVLGELALLGQITYFFARPGSGKTLITLRLLIDAIESGNIDPTKVYYINADDNHKGLTYKLKLAEKWGFQMLSPGYNGFSLAHFSEYLTKLSQSDNASGTVIILDTLKKFTDIMDKRKGTDFGKVARLYSSNGGTLIGLAHVNKHKDDAGKSVPSGTTDMTDDGDCSYTIELVREDKSSGIKTVCFENQKNRGDVALEASYQYSFCKDATYQEKLDSVRKIGDDERKSSAAQSVREAQLATDSSLIGFITEAIKARVFQRTELIAEVVRESGKSRSKVIDVLDRYTGPTIDDRWNFTKGDKNAKVYALTPPWGNWADTQETGKQKNWETGEGEAA